VDLNEAGCKEEQVPYSSVNLRGSVSRESVWISKQIESGSEAASVNLRGSISSVNLRGSISRESVWISKQRKSGNDKYRFPFPL
jgi:hypothetical protein